MGEVETDVLDAYDDALAGISLGKTGALMDTTDADELTCGVGEGGAALACLDAQHLGMTEELVDTVQGDADGVDVAPLMKPTTAAALEECGVVAGETYKGGDLRLRLRMKSAEQHKQ